MSMSSDSEQSTATERLHGGWLEHKSANDKSKPVWTPVWCVLKSDGTMFFFSSENTCLESHIGTLRLSKDSGFHMGTGDPREGYKFELHIQRKKKKFRVKTTYEREHWKAYILGVITGKVPQDGTLSPQDMQTIHSKFQRVWSPPLPSPAPSPSSSSFPSSHIRRPSAPPAVNLDSFSLPSGRERRPSVPSVNLSTGTGSSSGDGSFDTPRQRSFADFASLRDNSQDSGVIPDNTGGGPFMKHNFGKNGKPPSWFFEECSRDLAEKILRECPHMGNTLMRVSGSARPTGSYVISKLLHSTNEVHHYEVIRVAEGYRINAENCTSTMRNLGEVMEAFRQLSGPSTTHPMQSNDLKTLGVEYDAYSKGPIVAQHVEEFLPQSFRPDLDTPDNYEVPQQHSAPPPAPPPPPSIPAPPIPPTSSSLPKSVTFNTWGKDKTGEVMRQMQQTEGSAARTLGRPANSQQMKPSILHVSQSMQELDVVADLQAVARMEEQRLNYRGGIRGGGPPPLPEVPKDRPKLCKPASSGYANDVSASPEAEEGVSEAVHPRWEHRSKSVPAISQAALAATPGIDQLELKNKLAKRRAIVDQQSKSSASQTPQQSQGEGEEVEEEYEDISPYQNVS